MNLNSSLNNCLYTVLQCEGKEMQIHIYLCDVISVNVIKCVLIKELKLWLWLVEIILFLP
jgi:hypothetical protein